ncbi:hypothetical protein [Micromonospora sp. NPDC005161]
MTSPAPAPDHTLAVAVATLCAEGEGNYRRPRDAFLRNIRAVLPADHAAAALDDDALEAALLPLRDHLAEAFRVHFRRSVDGWRGVRFTCRLIRHPKGAPINA